MNDFENNMELEDEVEEVVNETKEEKFKRLSAQRVQKAAKYISALGNLSNNGSYEYSKENVDKIFGYLQKQLDDAKAKFDKNTDKSDKFEW